MDCYIIALDRYACQNRDHFIWENVLTIRNYYEKPIHPETPTSGNNLPKANTEDGKVIEAFRKLSDEKQKALLKRCLTMLLEKQYEQGALQFEAKQDWTGVHRFLNDRHLKLLTKEEFKALADSITPDNMPPKKKIGESTLSNSSRLGLPDAPYYVWTEKQRNHNKHTKHIYELCTALWALLCQMIYAKT